MNSLIKKTKFTFYSVLFTGILLIIASFYFLITLFSGMHFIWLSILGKLESICGCTNHLVFTNHPFLFSFLIISFFITLSFVSSIFYKATILRKKTNEFIKKSMHYQRHVLSRRLEKIIDKIGLRGKVIELKKNDFNVFCYGLFKPKICISSKFLKTLDDEELQAVLLHEQHHLLSSDPMKFYIVKIISSMFFFIPFLSLLSKRFFTLSEMTADDWVIEKMQEKTSLARAVYKTLEAGERTMIKRGLIIPLFDSMTEERVNKIVDDKYIFDIKLQTSRLFLFLGIFIFSVSVYAFLLFTGESVIAMHNESSCSEQPNISETCEMETAVNSCEMSMEGAAVNQSFCKEE